MSYFTHFVGFLQDFYENISSIPERIKKQKIKSNREFLKILKKILKQFHESIKLTIIVYTFVYFFGNSKYFYYNPAKYLSLHPFILMFLMIFFFGFGKIQALIILCLDYFSNTEENKLHMFLNILGDSFILSLIGGKGLGETIFKNMNELNIKDFKIYFPVLIIFNLMLTQLSKINKLSEFLKITHEIFGKNITNETISVLLLGSYSFFS